MNVSLEVKPPGSPRWRWAALSLAVLLLLSWGVLGYAVVDTAMSLDYCRVEQRHLKHDIEVLVRAASGRLSSTTFIDARAQLDPELPHRLDEANTLPLASVALHFGPDAILRGIVGRVP